MTKKTYPAPSLLDMKRVTTHPDEMLEEEFLKPLGMSARALAKEIDVPANRLTETIAGRRGMTPTQQSDSRATTRRPSGRP